MYKLFRRCLWKSENDDLSLSLHGTFKFLCWLNWQSWYLRSVSFYLSHLLCQHAENENKSRKRWFWLGCEHRRILVGYLKLFRFMNVMMVQTKCKLNSTELLLKLFHIQSKEIGNNKYYEETTELEKWQSEISPEYWR